MTFQEKLVAVRTALDTERQTLSDKGKASASFAIADFLRNAPADSCVRLYDIMTNAAAVMTAKQEG